MADRTSHSDAQPGALGEGETLSPSEQLAFALEVLAAIRPAEFKLQELTRDVGTRDAQIAKDVARLAVEREAVRAKGKEPSRWEPGVGRHAIDRTYALADQLAAEQAVDELKGDLAAKLDELKDVEFVFSLPDSNPPAILKRGNPVATATGIVTRYIGSPENDIHRYLELWSPVTHEGWYLEPFDPYTGELQVDFEIAT